MKEKLQIILNEYYGVGVYKVNNFTKKQLKEGVKDYLLDNGTADYVAVILVNELTIGQLINVIKNSIDMDINILNTLQANEILEC